MEIKNKVIEDEEQKFCSVHIHQTKQQTVVRVEQILLAGDHGVYDVPATVEDIVSANMGTSQTLRIIDSKSKTKVAVKVLKIGKFQDLVDSLIKQPGRSRRKRIPVFKTMTPLARPCMQKVPKRRLIVSEKKKSAKNSTIKKKEKKEVLQEADKQYYDKLQIESKKNQSIDSKDNNTCNSEPILHEKEKIVENDNPLDERTPDKEYIFNSETSHVSKQSLESVQNIQDDACESAPLSQEDEKLLENNSNLDESISGNGYILDSDISQLSKQSLEPVLGDELSNNFGRSSSVLEGNSKKIDTPIASSSGCQSPLKKKRIKPTIVETFQVNAEIIKKLRTENWLLNEEIKQKNGVIRMQADVIQELRNELKDLKYDNGITAISAEMEKQLHQLKENICNIFASNFNNCNLESQKKNVSMRLTNFDFPPPDPETNEVQILPNKKIPAQNLANAIKQESMQKRTKHLVESYWPDKTIRMTLGFEKKPGIERIITDEEVQEIRGLCLKCGEKSGTKFQADDLTPEKIKSWISKKLIDDRFRENKKRKVVEATQSNDNETDTTNNRRVNKKKTKEGVKKRKQTNYQQEE